MRNERTTKGAPAMARIFAVLLAAVMLCGVFAPAASAATPTIAPISDEERYAGLTEAEIASVESGMVIKIRNLNASEADQYILKFGNGNALRADGAISSVGDQNYPTMGYTLSQEGYPVVTYDKYRNMDGTALANTYGSNTLKELFLGIGKDGNQVKADGSNALYTATNNMFLYDQTTGYYKYDSKYNHAYFDTTTSSFTLYDSPLRPGAITSAYGYQSFGAFLPFNNVKNDVVKIMDENCELVSDVTFSSAASADKVIQYDSAHETNLKSAGNRAANLHAIYNDSETNLADNGFIMSVDFTFYIPKDGKFNGEDMVFHFSGDDDVWVYLDGVLVVDQGGTHRHTESNINFATGEVEYQHYHSDTETQPTDPTDRDYASWPWTWTTTTIKSAFDAAGVTKEFTGNTFAEYTEHTFKFVFLERGGEASNCELYFNLPVLPDGALDVMKTVDGELSDAAAEVQYTFILKDENGDPLADAVYSVMGTDGRLSAAQTTGADGVFKLRANERAVFESVEPDKEYTVVQLTEKKDANYTTYNEGTGATLDGAPIGTDSDDGYTTGRIEIDYDEKKVVDFTNDLKELEFTVEKTVGDYIPDDEEFEFDVEILVHDDEDDKKDVRYSETITLCGGETSDPFTVPVGAKVSVAERDPGVAYDTVAITTSGDQAATDTAARSYTVDAMLTDSGVTFHNTLKTFDLTVTKEIQGSMGDKSKEFPFTVTATINGQNVVFTTDDAYTLSANNTVCGFELNHNASVTVSGIPYGAQVSVNETNTDGYTAMCGIGAASAEGTEVVINSMTEDNTAAYLNTLDGLPPTGVELDSLPYVLMIVFALAGAAVMAVNRRRQREFE